ncbi:hypothetical protein ACFC8N_43160 [Streptomyces sp. NPDC055966]|uniref:hypothetical protein n=1 Tax=Streptomyces sp. NPDC055966 TaxID=3345669 RepID=UPI0035DB5C58
MPVTTVPPKPKLVYPRPPVAVLHAELFREATYEDGRPYGEPDDEEVEVTDAA